MIIISIQKKDDKGDGPGKRGDGVSAFLSEDLDQYGKEGLRLFAFVEEDQSGYENILRAMKAQGVSPVVVPYERTYHPSGGIKDRSTAWYDLDSLTTSEKRQIARDTVISPVIPSARLPRQVKRGI